MRIAPLVLKLTVITVALAIASNVKASQFKHRMNPAPTYKRGDGQVVPMSPSQQAVARGQWRHLDPTEIYKRTAQMVVVVIGDSKKDDGMVSQGTGFFLNQDTILTNWHVIRGAKEISMITMDGTRYTGGEVRTLNYACDVAAVHFSGISSKAWASLITDSDWVRIGEEVFVIGNPRGLRATMTNGLVSNWQANGALFQTTAPVDHGSSGSPVFNCYGQVIGMVESGLDVASEINYMISTNAIVEALEITGADHPKGFKPGITNGLELRNAQQITLDEPLNNGITPLALDSPLSNVNLDQPLQTYSLKTKTLLGLTMTILADIKASHNADEVATRIETYTTVYHEVSQTYQDLMPTFFKSNAVGSVSALEKQSMLESSQRMSDVGKVLTDESDAFDEAMKPYLKDFRVTAALTNISNEGRELRTIAQQYR